MRLTSGLMILGSLCGAITQTAAAVAEPTAVTICGSLEADGNLWLTLDGSSTKAFIDTDFDPPLAQDDYRKMSAVTSQLFQMSGSRVCISNSRLESCSTGDGMNVKVTRDSVITLAPDDAVSNVQASHCEIFLDKAGVVYVDGYGERDQRHYPQGAAHLFLKVTPDRLDGAVRSVRFYGKRSGNDVAAYASRVLPWQGASDYFGIVLDQGASGSFYVETDQGTRYWLNANQQPEANFDVNAALFASLDHAVGFFGYKYPAHGPDLDVGSLPKTADAARFLNPTQCR